jgi:hypothetical protein
VTTLPLLVLTALLLLYLLLPCENTTLHALLLVGDCRASVGSE